MVVESSIKQRQRWNAEEVTRARWKVDVAEDCRKVSRIVRRQSGGGAPR